MVVNVRRRKFASEYVQNGYNGVQAAMSAGYTTNYFAAGVTAHRLLKDAKIMDEIINQSEILSDDEILREISSVAKSKVDLKGSDKMKGLELLAKHRGLIKERVETQDVSEVEGRKSFLTDQLHRLQSRHLDDPLAYNQSVSQLRQLFTDQSDPAYDPLLDYTKHPENWPPVTVEAKEVEGVQ